jgi:hypothetical protein
MWSLTGCPVELVLPVGSLLEAAVRAFACAIRIVCGFP